MSVQQEDTNDDYKENINSEEEGDDNSEEAKPFKRMPYMLPVSSLSENDQKLLHDGLKFVTAFSNVRRSGPLLQEGTWKSRVDTFLAYLGYYNTHKATTKQDGELHVSFSMFDAAVDKNSVIDFSTWLRDERKLLPLSIKNCIMGVTVVLRYIMDIVDDTIDDKTRSKAEAALKMYERIRKQLHEENGRTQKKKTKKDLIENDKWLEWNEILGVVDKVRQMADNTPSSSKLVKRHRVARCHMSLVVLLLYTQLPPGRSKELFTLTMGPNGTLRINGDRYEIKLDASNHKTNEQKNLVFMRANAPELCDRLDDYILTHRPHLAKSGKLIPETNVHVFLNEDGKSFASASNWAKFLGGIFEKHTGKKISSKTIRSSFVTQTRIRSNEVSAVEKDVLAFAMSHSVRVADKVYNRPDEELLMQDAIKAMASMTIAAAPELAKPTNEWLNTVIAVKEGGDEVAYFAKVVDLRPDEAKAVGVVKLEAIEGAQGMYKVPLSVVIPTWVSTRWVKRYIDYERVKEGANRGCFDIFSTLE